MNEIEEFVDERQKAWCVHCGGRIGNLETNRDHVPSKSLLFEPYPENLPVIQVCRRCNTSFSLDEEYFVAFLGCVLTGSTDPDRQSNPRVERILRRTPSLRARIEKARTEHLIANEEKLFWKPEADRISRIVVKNARGHAFFEFGEPMLIEPSHMWWAPLESLDAQQRAEFENIGSGPCWPEVGSRMLTRVLTGCDFDGGWVTVQKDVYRYALVQHGLMLVRSVLCEYLATEVYWD